MEPLWRQKTKDESLGVERRARSRVEKREGELTGQLVNTYNWIDALTPPWQRSMAEVQELEDEDDNADLDALPRSTKLCVAELQRLGVPANSPSGLKVRRFHDQMARLSTLTRTQTFPFTLLPLDPFSAPLSALPCPVLTPAMRSRCLPACGRGAA